MALTNILTIPAITKGASNEVQVDKSALALDAKVSGDAYFSDQANWKTILINYQTPDGSQTQVLSCDASLATPVGDFNPSLTARDDWEVQSFVIMDFDGGSLEYVRSEMTTAAFDIAIALVLASYESFNSALTVEDISLFPSNDIIGGFTQTFTAPVNPNIDSVDFMLGIVSGKSVPVTGNVYVKIQEVASIDGSNIHLGAVVAKSLPVLIPNLSLDASALTTFTFTSTVSLVTGNRYVMTVYGGTPAERASIDDGSRLYSYISNAAAGSNPNATEHGAPLAGMDADSGTTIPYILYSGWEVYFKLN